MARLLSAIVKTQGFSCIAVVRQRSGFEVEAALCKEVLTVSRRFSQRARAVRLEDIKSGREK